MKGILFFLWILCGLLFWFLRKDCDCCRSHNSVSNTTAAVIAPVAAAPIIKKLLPIGFKCSDDSPRLEQRWSAYKDSLVRTLKDNQILEIKAFELSGENNDTKATSLALSRAQKVRQLFSLKDDRIRVSSGRKPSNCKESELYNLLTFRMMQNTAKIKEIDDKTIIYFPTNSTNKLSDGEVETYLNDVAERVKKSGERVRLVGHTDNVGGDGSSNNRLGQNRAYVIRDYLMSKGVVSAKIKTSSKGAKRPIADNNTASGRAENRRTELQIFK